MVRACLVCGKEFFVKQGYGWGKRKTCSKKCGMDFTKNRLRILKEEKQRMVISGHRRVFLGDGPDEMV